MNIEVPVQTEAQQILAKLAEIEARQDRFAEAINSLGGNVQWIIDSVNPFIQMLGNPAFMGMIPGMLGGMPTGEDQSHG